MTAPDHVIEDVTVNLSGLWLLQAVAGIPTLAPELKAWPYGAARSDEWIDSHPGFEVLLEQGLVDAAGRVDDKLAQRLNVLAVPDVEVAMRVGLGPLSEAMPDVSDPSTWRSIPHSERRVVLARRAGRWVSAVRVGDDVTIDDVAGGGREWLAAVLIGLLDSLHPCEPSRMAALNVPLDEILRVASTRAEASDDADAGPARDASLRALGVRAGDVAELGDVLDEPLAEAVLYARAHVETEVHHSESVVDVRDTDAGRVVLYKMAPMRGSAQEWMTIAPGRPAQIEQGVLTVLTGVARSWDTHQRQ